MKYKKSATTKSWVLALKVTNDKGIAKNIHISHQSRMFRLADFIFHIYDIDLDGQPFEFRYLKEGVSSYRGYTVFQLPSENKEFLPGVANIRTFRIDSAFFGEGHELVLSVANKPSEKFVIEYVCIQPPKPRRRYPFVDNNHSTQKGTKKKNECGLCGNTKKLKKTECCDEWICDDEHTYQMFSYAHNSCARNHSRYTLCGFHHIEKHEGHWQDCTECAQDFELEMIVWYGTNEYNFEKLKNPPKYEPARCHSCNNIIILSEGGYSQSSKGYTCYKCCKLFR